MQISGIGVADGAPSAASQNGLSSLNSEDFFKLLVAEMQSQDPFEPSSTADIISQVSQIRTIEQSSELTSTLDAMTQQQRMGGASELIGKFVQAIAAGPDGEAAMYEGVVTAVRFLSDGSAVLELDTGDAVYATDVMRVSDLNGAPVEASVGEGDEEESSDDKSDATQRQRGSGKSWFGLEDLFRV